MSPTQAADTLHVGLAPDTDDFTTYNPGESGPGSECQCDENAEIVFRQDGGDGDHEAHPRKALENADQTLDGLIYKATKIAACHAQEEPHHHGAEGGGHRKGHGGPGAVDGAGQDIPAQGVGTQPVGQRSGLQDFIGIHENRIIGRNKGRKNSTEQEKKNDDLRCPVRTMEFPEQFHAPPPLFGLNT